MRKISLIYNVFRDFIYMLRFYVTSSVSCIDFLLICHIQLVIRIPFPTILVINLHYFVHLKLVI